MQVKVWCQSNLGNIDYYGTLNGLPNNSVLSIYQDSKGFLWIGTYNGLCRYDGKEFKIYRNFSEEGDEIWINSITVIKEDAEKNLWVSSRGGVIARLDSRTRQWKQFHINGKDYITDMYIENGTVWFSSKQGKIGKIQGDSLSVLTRVAGVLESKFQKYSPSELIIAGVIIYKLNIKTGKVEGVPIRNSPELSEIEGMETNEQYAFYFLKNKKVVSQKLSDGSLFTAGFNFNYFKNKPGILSNGNLLMVHEEQLAEVTPEGRLLYKINLAEHSGAFKGNSVNVVYKDNSGLIWIGTNGGLFKVDKSKTAFKKYASNIFYNTISHHYVRALYTRKNEVWVGTKEGKTGRLLFDTVNKKVISQTWYPMLLPDGTVEDAYTVNCIISDGGGNLWAGGNEGMYRMKKNENAFKKIVFSYNGKPENIHGIWALFIDGRGNLLAGTADDGLCQVNLKTLVVNKYRITNNGSNKFSVWNIFKSSDNELWAGTGKGIYKLKFDSARNTYSLHNDFLSGKEELKKGNIWGITEDENGNLWLGTTETGIYMLETKTGRVFNYTTKDGLVDNITSSLVADRQGNLWISTVDGLSKFEIKNKRFTNYKEEDGIISNDFNFKASTYTSWGELFFATKVGITSFKPSDIGSSASTEAPVEITGIKIKGTELMNAGNAIELEHNRNDISFNFALLEYTKELSHKYRYMLKGYDTAWQHTGYNNPAASYTNLPPGRYTFVVMASPDGEAWSKKSAQVSINIIPAFWQRLYFWLAAGTAVILVVFFSVRWRIKSLLGQEREKARVQKAMAELEMKALRAQMNPHFIFNAVGAIQHYIVKNDIVQANEYLAKFARLMRLYLESSRNNFSKLGDEINLLELYISLEKLRFEEKFDYTISVQGNLPAGTLQIPSMLLQPFVENAINHGLVHRTSKGNLLLKFMYDHEAGNLNCVIDDNGIGRVKAAQLRDEKRNGHISRAGEIVEERVKTLFEAEEIEVSIGIIDKFDAGGIPAGTRVEVKIPCKGFVTIDNENINN